MPGLTTVHIEPPVTDEVFLDISRNCCRSENQKRALNWSAPGWRWFRWGRGKRTVDLERSHKHGKPNGLWCHRGEKVPFKKKLKCSNFHFSYLVMLLLPIELYTNPRLNLATTWLWWISVVTWEAWWKKWSCTSVIHSHLQGFSRCKRTQTGQAPQSFKGWNNRQQVRQLVAFYLL